MNVKQYALPVGLIGIGILTLGVIALPEWARWVVGIGLIAGGVFLFRR